MKIKDWLKGPGKDACLDAKKWLQTLPNDSSMNDAWKLCQNPSWLIWAAIRSDIPCDDKVWRQLDQLTHHT